MARNFSTLRSWPSPHPNSARSARPSSPTTTRYILTNSKHILEPTHKSNFANDSRTANLNEFINRQGLASKPGFGKTQPELELREKQLSRRPALEEFKGEEQGCLGVPRKLRK